MILYFGTSDFAELVVGRRRQYTFLVIVGQSEEFYGYAILSLSPKGQTPPQNCFTQIRFAQKLRFLAPRKSADFLGFPALISALSDFPALFASLTRENPHEEIEGKIELRKIPYVIRNAKDRLDVINFKYSPSFTLVMTDCTFCKIYASKQRIIYENEHFFAQFDTFPSAWVSIHGLIM